jgi:hypothetical protein
MPLGGRILSRVKPGEYRHTVASRPKILENNSKPAKKRKRMAGKIGGRSAADLGQKRP